MTETKSLDQAELNRLRQRATYASLSVASVLIVGKLVAWAMTGSVSMLSSLFDSTFDLLASMVTAIGVRSALKPPDHDHRYGHGKAEPLAALAQAAFVIGSSLLLGFEAVNRFLRPQPLHNEIYAYAVTVGALVLTFGLIRFQQHVVNQTGSTAVGADRLHYVGDLAANLAVLVAFALTRATGLDWFDPAFAMMIAGGMIWSAVKILRHALGSLMDAELPDAQRDEIIGYVRAHPGVCGVHDLRTRTDGGRVFIELHVEMDGAQSLKAAHDLTERIMQDLRARMPNADIVIHQDPDGHEEPRLY